jgi:nucleotide sugar dehydrogenase
MSGLAVVGAGRIGVPWAAVMASQLGVEVTCIDIDEDRVKRLNRGEAPFAEPQLEAYLSTAVDRGTLTATTDASAVADHRHVAFAVNAPRTGMGNFLNVVREYAAHFDDDHVVINRVTLPVEMIGQMRETVTTHADGNPSFVAFPERLAEGKAIEEIETLPKIVGTDDRQGQEAMYDLLAGLECDIEFTDPETAMFVKLIDNSYRDALFAISNQIAYTADELGLDAHKAIALANYDYPRNDIPSPGPVGGKCLPKDPHFLTDEWVCDQPTTPDLFNATRRTNAFLSSYVVTQILRRRPSSVAMLGLAYKRGVGDTHTSPASDVADELTAQGVEVSAADPHVPGCMDIREALDEAEIVVLAVNHKQFEGIEPEVNEYTTDDAFVYDLWGMLDQEVLNRTYGGFGIAEMRM